MQHNLGIIIIADCLFNCRLQLSLMMDLFWWHPKLASRRFLSHFPPQLLLVFICWLPTDDKNAWAFNLMFFISIVFHLLSVALKSFKVQCKVQPKFVHLLCIWSGVKNLNFLTLNWIYCIRFYLRSVWFIGFLNYRRKSTKRSWKHLNIFYARKHSPESLQISGLS